VPDGATVFLVDEDDAVRDAIALSLRAAGHTVAAFGSGRQFLDAYQPGTTGCLVVDMDLSDLGIVGVLRALAASPPALPAIITSRRLMRRAPTGGLPPGRILYLDKPFGVDELLQLIRIALAASSGSQRES
jgi:FixJ family two-component response regulator